MWEEQEIPLRVDVPTERGRWQVYDEVVFAADKYLLPMRAIAARRFDAEWREVGLVVVSPVEHGERRFNGWSAIVAGRNVARTPDLVVRDARSVLEICMQDVDAALEGA